MKTTYARWLSILLGAAVFSSTVSAQTGRKIEEVIVTAERKEASISDTSISITALTGDFIDDFGIRNQSDLQNLVPATTIQPYDSAIRGVGRNFRNLGGDPGVSTYLNGVYSEDLYTATIQSFWDVDRIEVLRGPQGTLYGRNAVGGAINFIYKKPTDEFEASLKTVVGDFGTLDGYGVVSGPLIDGVLNGRLSGSMRRHDGWVEERGPVGPDLDSGDEKNLVLQLEWIINENLSMNLRSNRSQVDRTFGGADGGGLIVLQGENFETDGSRDFSRRTNGLRDVDPAQTNPLADDFLDPTQPTISFTNPVSGEEILGQRARAGIDPGQDSGLRNSGFGNTVDPNECVFLDRGDIEGDDLCAFTNGLNNETFNQQGNQFEINWDVNESLSLKYIFGLNTLLYERITDDDSTSNPLNDRQFYVNHEAEYVSHELQAFWDVSDTLSFTSGVFFYDARIDQRGDFFSGAATSQFEGDPGFIFDNILATVAPGAIPGDPPLTFLVGADPVTVDTARETAQANGAPEGFFTIVTGAWQGLGSVQRGIETFGSDLHYDTTTEREAFAAYTQGVWDINEAFTLTFGLRYAVDEIDGQESLARYAESAAVLGAVGLDLGTANIIRGAIDPATLQPTGVVEPWLAGVPITFGAFRELSRRDTDLTWRLNLDWNVTDDSLIYLNATTGYRSGGFNLVFFSQTPEFDPEELTAYEIGYKGQFFDGQMQLNASAYLYDYDTIHTRTEEACPPDQTTLSAQSACAVTDSTTSIEAAPGAEVRGFEFDILWLATQNLTLGGNFSYTDTEFTESFVVVDGADPRFANGVYSADNNLDRAIDVRGNALPQIPETKGSLYAVYNIPMGERGNIDLAANWSYIDDVNFSPFEAELDTAPSYDRLDLRATWTSAEENWIVSGFLNNVFDEIGIRQILRGGVGDGYRRTAQVTEPRLFGLEVTYNFR